MLDPDGKVAKRNPPAIAYNLYSHQCPDNKVEM